MLIRLTDAIGGKKTYFFVKWLFTHHTKTNAHIRTQTHTQARNIKAKLIWIKSDTKSRKS